MGYLKYALEDYNHIAGRSEKDLRVLTEAEMQQIIGSMKYSFDMKSLQEAYNKG